VIRKWIKELTLGVVIVFILSNIISFLRVENINIDVYKELKSDKVQIVYFFTDWCRVCKIQSPIIDDLSHDKEIIKIKVKSNESKVLANKFKVGVYPTIFYIKKDGHVGYNESGYTSKYSIILKSFIVGVL